MVPRWLPKLMFTNIEIRIKSVLLKGFHVLEKEISSIQFMKLT